jgi:hypothetical protein
MSLSSAYFNADPPSQQQNVVPEEKKDEQRVIKPALNIGGTNPSEEKKMKFKVRFDEAYQKSHEEKS